MLGPFCGNNDKKQYFVDTSFETTSSQPKTNLITKLKSCKLPFQPGKHCGEDINISKQIAVLGYKIAFFKSIMIFQSNQISTQISVCWAVQVNGQMGRLTCWWLVIDCVGCWCERRRGREKRERVVSPPLVSSRQTQTPLTMSTLAFY